MDVRPARAPHEWEPLLSRRSPALKQMKEPLRKSEKPFFRRLFLLRCPSLTIMFELQLLFLSAVSLMMLTGWQPTAVRNTHRLEAG